MKIIHIYRNPVKREEQYRLMEKDGLWRVCQKTKAGWRKVPNTPDMELEWQARGYIEGFAHNKALIHDRLPERFVE